FDGLPIQGSHVFGASVFFTETGAYVGVLALALAATAVAARWRRPETIGLAIVVAVMLSVVFVRPLITLLNKAPAIGTVDWTRGLMLVSFAVGALAAIGVDALLTAPGRPAVRRGLTAALAALAVIVVL